MERERRIWFRSTRVFYHTISTSLLVSLLFYYWVLRNSPSDFHDARFEFTEEISVSAGRSDDSGGGGGGGAEAFRNVLDSIQHNTATKRAETSSSVQKQNSNLQLKYTLFKEEEGYDESSFERNRTTPSSSSSSSSSSSPPPSSSRSPPPPPPVADVKIEKKPCDVSKGKWVFDETYPLYSNVSCPYIDEGFSCQTNGRLDSDYMKWRWQPDHCDIPRFNAVKMLEMIRGKRLVFVGDSINRNQWESMMCLLANGVKDHKKVYEARGRRITKMNKNFVFRFMDYQCSVEYHVTHFLVRESKARVRNKRVPTLRIDAIDRSFPKWRGADILVFNTAHWWSHYKTKSGKNYYQEGNHVHPQLDAAIAFRRAMTTWATWVDRNVNSHKTQVFFRTSAPSHFSGGEWNSGGHCKERRKPLNSSLIRMRKSTEKNVIVEQITEQMKTPVALLDITKISGLRIDGHPSVYGIRRIGTGSSSSVQDCSHWCLPGVPDTWNELLYFFLLSKHKSLPTH